MSEAPNNEPLEALLCSECLEDRGVSPVAHSLGAEDGRPLSTLRLATTGRKLDRDSLLALARSSAAFRVYAPRLSAAAAHIHKPRLNERPAVLLLDEQDGLPVPERLIRDCGNGIAPPLWIRSRARI